jgi:hypothetical protein
MRRMAYVNIARGSDGMLFFRERVGAGGAGEELLSGGHVEVKLKLAAGDVAVVSEAG